MTCWRVSCDYGIISNKSAVSYRDADLYPVPRQLYFFTVDFMTLGKELCAETDKTPVYGPSVLTHQRGLGLDLMSWANQCPARWLWLMPLMQQSVIMVIGPTNTTGEGSTEEKVLTGQLFYGVLRCRFLFVGTSHLEGNKQCHGSQEITFFYKMIQ